MELQKSIVAFFEAQTWLDEPGKAVQSAIRSVFEAGGQTGIRIRDVLHGVWLGHPLHPVLTDLPVGAWSAAAGLDLLEATTGKRGFGEGADVAIQVGVAGAVGAAVTGLTDYQHVSGEARRFGLAHAGLNTLALALYLGSLAARKGRQRGLGRSLAFAGLAVASASAYLGGELVFSQKIGVDHAPEDTGPNKFTAVMAEEELPEATPRKAMLGETPIVLVRRGRRVYALAESCSHLGGPLSEGQLHEDQNSLSCPWHGSTFSLEDGSILEGPATYPQPCFETRIRSGQVEVRSAR